MLLPLVSKNAACNCQVWTRLECNRCKFYLEFLKFLFSGGRNADILRTFSSFGKYLLTVLGYMRHVGYRG